jgi:stage V sporulation protein D (sporulation-specific penicillin-binding protein)
MKRFVGFGYGISATPLQIANAYSTVANKGQMMRPLLVKNIYTPEGGELEEFHPENIRRVISEKTADTLASLLTGVVERGTGKNARIEGLDIAGKTGTSQQYVGGVYSKRDYNASFAGFFPAGNPQIALFVIIDRPQGNYYGGATAAPIFHDIAARTVAAYEKYIFTEQTGDYELPDSVFVPEVRGLGSGAAEEILDAAELDAEEKNDGRFVIDQKPGPGQYVERGSDIILTFSKNNYTSIDSLKAGLDLRGLPLRRAVAMAHASGVEVEINGSGRVYRTRWSERKGKPVCRIYCK